jgi:3-isopropylmalate dehydrogenase
MKRVAVIEGDGVGKEVVPVGVALLEALRARRGWDLEIQAFDLGADRVLRDGATFPEEDRDAIRETCDAVLLGALGDPRVGSLDYARDILFGLRFGFDLYANLRPVQCLHDRLMPLAGRRAAACDFVVFRENTEGVYAGLGGRFQPGTAREVAIEEDLNTHAGVARIVRAAFALAERRGASSVHLVDKSNAMRHVGALWQRVFREVAGEHPAITPKHMYVDAMCFHLLRDPSQFEVVVTSNLFGDIVTDLGAALQGGMGMAGSANLHPGARLGLFEPVHGSAPDIAGQDRANPFATVLTVGMLLTHLGFEGEEAKLVELVRRGVEERKCTADVGGELGTRAVGEWLLANLA